MPRALILANPGFFVTLDACGWVRDLYYPHVGELNHVLGYPCRVGLAVDDAFCWLDEDCAPEVGWESAVSPVARVAWRLPDEQIDVEMLAAADPVRPVLVRRFVMQNGSHSRRTVKLFLHHDLRVAESDIGDTALFHPGLRAMVHHKREFWFACGCFRQSPPIVQFACGVKGFGGAEGTWRDAEDGALSMNAIAQGSVDSTVMVQAEAEGGGSVEFGVWLLAAAGLEEAESAAREVENASAEDLLGASRDDFQVFVSGANVSDERGAAFARSLHVLRSHCADTGAVLAANDTDILQSARAHYSYVWPRDGAIISVALARAGHLEPARRFLEFCMPLISVDRPYFLQKYGPTGTVGASWHPWIEHGREIVPFQEDGTALVLWAAGEVWRDPEARPPGWYDRFIRPMAGFLASYIDPVLGLPLPSFDPWEERRGIHAWTCGAVVAGLRAASWLAKGSGQSRDAERFARAADEVAAAVREHLWHPGLGRYVRTTHLDERKHVLLDETPDSSIAGLVLFGGQPLDDERAAATVDAVFEALEVRTDIGGIARNRGDYYFRCTDDLERVPGNPWVICTLWAARVASMRGDTERASRLIDWVISRASSAGMLPEQVHPFTGEALAVQPLAWSHAELVLAMLDLEAAEFRQG